MDKDQLLAALNDEIARLQEVKRLLSGTSTNKGQRAKPGRKPGRKMSPESRARIAEAQRARWAKARERK